MKEKQKRRRDMSQLAKLVVEIATGQKPKSALQPPKSKKIPKPKPKKKRP